MQQAELPIGQLNGHTGRIFELTRSGIESPARELVTLTLRSRWDSALSSLAAQQRAHSRQQLAWITRFGEVVVSTHLESHDLVRFGAEGAEHYDRRAVLGCEAAGRAQPVLARQHG